MIKELKKIHGGEPACQKRSDSDHLRFMIHRRRNEPKFDFAIELNGIKTWVVPDVPSMDPLEQRAAREDEHEAGLQMNLDLPEEETPPSWDKGNYIPIDDNGNMLSEFEALQSLKQGALKFFLQGKKLVGEFTLLKKEKSNWLLMKRHDEFALYNYYRYQLAEG